MAAEVPPPMPTQTKLTPSISNRARQCVTTAWRDWCYSGNSMSPNLLQGTTLLRSRPHRGNNLRSVKYPKLDITFMTAHASKGLGYDNVIVINGRNETYGFPSKIEDDPVLSFVIKGDRSIDYAEERRLFYVAMTRTKNRVYFLAPEENPSEFLLEIKKDYKNVVLRGNWNENPPQNSTAKKICPICGYPMQFRYKNAYGLRLHICTNEPEICGFMTNEHRANKLAIMKCDQCRDGCGQECGQKFPPRCARFPPKAKKSLETLGFQGFVLVEISGIEPLTS